PPPLASNPWHPGGSPSIYSQAARPAHLTHTPSRPRRSKSRAEEGHGSAVRVGEGVCTRERAELQGKEHKGRCARLGYVRGCVWTAMRYRGDGR
ncbi:unnamed protein product, partial [Ectocarpus sp. 12 AP-2014]